MKHSKKVHTFNTYTQELDLEFQKELHESRREASGL